MDDLSVRYLTDAELIAARQGGPLEPFGAKRTGLPPRRGRGVVSSNRMSWLSWDRARPIRHKPSSN